jgi:Flp pilus assembly pilin Flp
MIRSKSAQRILEYILILAAVTAAVVVATTGPIKNSIDKMFNDSGTVMDQQTSSFLNNAAGGGNTVSGNTTPTTPTPTP